MSYRERRLFCEHLRTLGYSDVVSHQALVEPNFELMASYLSWIVYRLESTVELSDDISDLNKRLVFLEQACRAIYLKTDIILNIQHLYFASHHAIKELLRVTTLLYAYYMRPSDYHISTLFQAKSGSSLWSSTLPDHSISSSRKELQFKDDEEDWISDMYFTTQSVSNQSRGLSSFELDKLRSFQLSIEQTLPLGIELCGLLASEAGIMQPINQDITAVPDISRSSKKNDVHEQYAGSSVLLSSVVSSSSRAIERSNALSFSKSLRLGSVEDPKAAYETSSVPYHGFHPKSMPHSTFPPTSALLTQSTPTTLTSPRHVLSVELHRILQQLRRDLWDESQKLRQLHTEAESLRVKLQEKQKVLDQTQKKVDASDAFREMHMQPQPETLVSIHHQQTHPVSKDTTSISPDIILPTSLQSKMKRDTVTSAFEAFVSTTQQLEALRSILAQYQARAQLVSAENLAKAVGVTLFSPISSSQTDGKEQRKELKNITDDEMGLLSRHNSLTGQRLHLNNEYGNQYGDHYGENSFIPDDALNLEDLIDEGSSLRKSSFDMPLGADAIDVIFGESQEVDNTSTTSSNMFQQDRGVFQQHHRPEDDLGNYF